MKWLLVSDNNSYVSSLSRLLQEKFPASEIFVKSERDSLGFGFDFLCGITHAAFFCPLNKNTSVSFGAEFKNLYYRYRNLSGNAGIRSYSVF